MNLNQKKMSIEYQCNGLTMQEIVVFFKSIHCQQNTTGRKYKLANT